MGFHWRATRAAYPLAEARLNRSNRDKKPAAGGRIEVQGEVGSRLCGVNGQHLSGGARGEHVGVGGVLEMSFMGSGTMAIST